VPNGLSRHEVGGLERSELLEDAGAAGPDSVGELLG
jgi:hypothetical protein